MRLAVVAAALTVAAVGCGPKNPDYQSIWSTTPTTTTTVPSEKPVPFSQYLESNGVSGEPVAPDKVTDLTISMPIPPGWQKVDKPNIPPTTELIAKGDGFPNAMLIVFKLGGDFNAAELVKHGNDDARLAQNFKQLESSNADFHGFPSSMIEGSYNLGDQRLHTINRIVIAHGSGADPEHYLIQLAVTSVADQAVADAVDVEAIIHGFTVAAK
ncbi:LpqN/LpqT family lipoprotein [Mycobacterium cookii]|uniref:Putative lipoprotein LpqT n=1 Tax=Mycobacterium cookii TaxID=1775 RepID=A0A7I7KXC5_9MYCO|nr:LpqN/LpqT family lipoprotein [Mycobacterium cookii]BBX46148.1 putative lipoprotein LpqT [Mycobacterium cookii]